MKHQALTEAPKPPQLSNPDGRRFFFYDILVVMTKHLITLPSGNEIAYWTHHEVNKPTLILVHGFTGSHEGFQYLVPKLNNFHLIIPDLPGFGISPLPHESLTLQHLGALLAEFVNVLSHAKQPYVLGHSMGSLVVAEAIRQRPYQFNKKLVLISPVPSSVGIFDLRSVGVAAGQIYYTASHRLPLIGKRLASSKKITRFSTKMIMTARDNKLKEAIHNHHIDNLNYISSIGWYKKLHRQINRTGISRYRQAFREFEVLIINGEKDSVTPLGRQKSVAKILQAKLKTIKGVGHLSHYETPEALAKEILDFLR